MYNFNQPVMGETFIIEQLLYIPIGNHVPVYNRPYTVNATADAINTIVDRSLEQRTGKITSDIIGNVTGQIIQPNVVGENTVVNENWVSTRRFVFILKVKALDAIGTEINSYIQGYTEYDGISPTGNIDENLVHYINNIIETTSMNIQTPMGVIHKEKLYNIYNVFASNSQEFFTQRPGDILENMSLLSATSLLSDGGMDVTGMNVSNYINPFNNAVLSSSVENNIGSEYLCKVLNAGIHNQKAKSIFLNSYEVEDNTAGGYKVVEPSVNDNRFVKYLSRMAGLMSVKESFTFNQLMGVDATIYDRFTLVNLTKNYMDPLVLNTPETGEYWHGQDPITLKAYSLIESSVALATKYGFNKMFFTVTNMSNPSAMGEVFISNFNSFIKLDEQDFNYLLEIFKNKFISDIFIGETMGGVIPIYAEVFVDLVGTSKINLSYAGYPSTWYTIPTAANSLFAPVVTLDKNSLDAVTLQFQSVIDAVSYGDNKSTPSFY